MRSPVFASLALIGCQRLVEGVNASYLSSATSWLEPGASRPWPRACLYIELLQLSQATKELIG